MQEYRVIGYDYENLLDSATFEQCLKAAMAYVLDYGDDDSYIEVENLGEGGVLITCPDTSVTATIKLDQVAY